MTNRTFRFCAGDAPLDWNDREPLPLGRVDDRSYYYIDDPGLEGAVDAALALGLPLLLTGQPGVGKTQLAYHLGSRLRCETICYGVKSTSEAQDLCYFIDHLHRWHVAQGMDQRRAADSDDAQKSDNEQKSGNKQKSDDAQKSIDIRRFLRFQGLGLAIVRAMPEKTLQDRRLVELAWEGRPRDRQPSVVLIDEIDKAPLDFTNDLLDTVQRLQFTVPELGRTPLSIYANADQPKQEELKYRPIVIITSNSDKVLPEAFLRRCLYYHIKPPSEAALEHILAHRIADYQQLPATIKKPMLAFYLYLRDHARLEKKPSTAELLNWFALLGKHQRDEPDKVWQHQRDEPDKDWQQLAKICLLKHEPDQKRIGELVRGWHEAADQSQTQSR